MSAANETTETVETVTAHERLLAESAERHREGKRLFEAYFDALSDETFHAYREFVLAQANPITYLFGLVAVFAESARIERDRIAGRDEAMRDPLAYLSDGEVSSHWGDTVAGPTLVRDAERALAENERLTRDKATHMALLVELAADAEAIETDGGSSAGARALAKTMREKIDALGKAGAL